MRHSNLQNMLDDLMENPDEIIISSNSKHYALYENGNGEARLITGDFSDDPEACEAEVRKILNHKSTNTAES